MDTFHFTCGCIDDHFVKIKSMNKRGCPSHAEKIDFVERTCQREGCGKSFIVQGLRYRYGSFSQCEDCRRLWLNFVSYRAHKKHKGHPYNFTFRHYIDNIYSGKRILCDHEKPAHVSEQSLTEAERQHKLIHEIIAGGDPGLLAYLEEMDAAKL